MLSATAGPTTLGGVGRPGFSLISTRVGFINGFEGVGRTFPSVKPSLKDCVSGYILYNRNVRAPTIGIARIYSDRPDTKVRIVEK
jgi:hypothetical protein